MESACIQSMVIETMKSRWQHHQGRPILDFSLDKVQKFCFTND